MHLFMILILGLFIMANAQIDYYENKHLFIMQIINGEIAREW